MKQIIKKKQLLHVGIAEKGKLYALEGEHKKALKHYREALRMAQVNNDPELFSQHYMQCVVESLEISGNHDEVISYGLHIVDLIDKQEEKTLFVKKKLVSELERLAIQYLYKGQSEEAKETLIRIKETLPQNQPPISRKLLDWMYRGYVISPKQLRELQNQYEYFIVRNDNVRKDLAIDIDHILPEVSF